MARKDPSQRMPWHEPDLDTVIRVGWILTGLGLILFTVSLAGELLGWWDLLGEVGMWVGAILTIVVGFATWTTSAGREQVQTVHGNILSVHEAVIDNGSLLGSMDAKLGKLDKLDVIEDALVTEDGETSRLDIVQVELDRQTGVLDRQLSVLGEIRDAL